MTNNYVLLNGKLSRDIEVSKNDKGNSFVVILHRNISK